MKLSYRIYFFILFPILMLPLALVTRTPPFLCAYMLVIMSAFWALDILPYGITSLIPLLFAPLMDIELSNTIAKAYSSDSLMLCLGRLILACAYQRHQIHRRFGLFLLLKIGQQPRQIILACMLPSFILTMFISNTATAPIMLEFAIEVIKQMKEIEDNYHGGSMNSISSLPNEGTNLVVNRQSIPDHLDFLQYSYLEEQYPSMTSAAARNRKISNVALERSQLEEEEQPNNKMKSFSRALFLSTGWAATSGSLATIVASGPNLIFYGTVTKDFGFNVSLNYGTFLIVGLPMAIVIFILTWLWVGVANMGPKEFFSVRKNTHKEDLLKEVFQKAKDDLGPISFPELSCLFLTGLIVILWITRSLGKGIGWGHIFSIKKGDTMNVSDATPMMLIIILIYIWPSKWRFWKVDEDAEPGSERLLSWEFTHKSLPWSIIFLLGAGFAMTDICTKSTLASVVGGYITKLSRIGIVGMVFLSSILACISTELFSSTSILPIFLVVFFQVACDMHVHPLYFSLPLTFSSSLAYCLPSATTPNIAIFNRGLATTRQMIKYGILMDIVFIFVVVAFVYAIGVPIFTLKEFPEWFIKCANKTNGNKTS